jgi:hypothetical protein
MNVGDPILMPHESVGWLILAIIACGAIVTGWGEWTARMERRGFEV